MPSALTLRDVRITVADLRRARAYPPAEADPERVVLDAVSLELAAGARLALLGVSGGGKTSLLRLCARLVDPGAGEVVVLGRPLLEWPVAELRRRAVFVPHAPALFAASVREELAVGLRWQGRPVPAEAALREVLSLLRLEVALDAAPAELSGGQQARLCLGRALLLAPELLLLDEPTSGVDVRAARELLADLAAWAEARGTALLLSTHRPEDAASLRGEAAVLLAGRLRGPFPGAAVASGEVEDPEVRAFLRAEAGSPSPEGAA
ncbi:MAG: ATP-binding cassette domain-containing protein [Planctomycetota bacterium]